jgi:hypothetical protein
MVRKSERKRPLERPRCKFRDNVKNDKVGWTKLAEVRDNLVWTLVNMQ